jgi:hypothetical protein
MHRSLVSKTKLIHSALLCDVYDYHFYIGLQVNANERLQSERLPNRAVLIHVARLSRLQVNTVTTNGLPLLFTLVAQLLDSMDDLLARLGLALDKELVLGLVWSRGSGLDVHQVDMVLLQCNDD